MGTFQPEIYFSMALISAVMKLGNFICFDTFSRCIVKSTICTGAQYFCAIPCIPSKKYQDCTSFEKI